MESLQREVRGNINLLFTPPGNTLRLMVTNLVTVILFWVSDHVLSEQITVALPKVSTAGNLR